MRNTFVACFFISSVALLSGCVTTNDPYNQPYNGGYTGYTVGVGPSYWGSGYSPNPGYNYGYGNASLMYYGATGYYGGGYNGYHNTYNNYNAHPSFIGGRRGHR